MSGCACIDVYADGCEQVDFQYWEKRKARKEYECGECGGSIARGEAYEIQKEVDRGKWQPVHRTCADCLSIRDKFFCGGWFWGAVNADFVEHVREVHGEIGCGCTEGLTEGAKERLFALMDSIFAEFEEGE